ncbi:MAG: UDP-N-acetylmuramate dehydrogenase [Bdellovibrionaceae bacterium]|nr:UDP-N-acetylmuramate dehydrogenase [Pseudobdellovibrionaceae bacterium]
MEIKPNIPLGKYTSWQVGGPAEFFCLPENLNDLQTAISHADAKNLKLTVFGGGSNVLIADKGVSGLVICLQKFSGTETKEENGRLHIIAWAGTPKSELLKIFLKNKLAPALFLGGIPGDVGGGVVMNAGVAENFLPREFVEITDWVEILRVGNGRFHTYRFSKDQIHWEYRHTNGWQPGFIIRVGMSWPIEPDATIIEKVRSANKIRLTKQPLDMPSCGSVFRNPEGHKAAQLIDGCGLKGYQVGDAQVSLKHANFIVNIGKAKASDIAAIIDHVRATVKKERGIDLHTEVVRIGDF